MTAPWGPKHKIEALRRTYELAAELAAAGHVDEAEWLSIEAVVGASTEEAFRATLFDPAGVDFGIVRIAREVRRVRGLAEGLLVRETATVLRDGGGNTILDGFRTNEEHVRRTARECRGVKLLRVTRIRSAS